VLAVLDSVLGFYAIPAEEIPADIEVIETLLAVSKCGSSSKQHQILSLIDRLLKRSGNAYHLQAEAVYQRSVLFRLNGDVASSNRLLEDFLDHTDMATHLKTHHVIGRLHLSKAANYAYNLDFCLADRESQLWIPSNSDITEKKFDVLWSQIYSAGKILKGQGQFHYAIEMYSKCLQTPNLRDSKKHLVLSHLVDTSVELHYSQLNSIHSPHSENLLDNASKMIKTEIERVRVHKPRSKGFRRLLLSLSEVEIRRNQLVAAERILQEVSSIYETLAEPDIVDRLGHMRAYIALARISPLDEAESYWLNALSLGRKYYPFEEEVFTVAIIHLFLCITRLQINDLEGGKAAFDYAARICLTSSPTYLIPGAGTYLFEEAQKRIESLAGWRLPKHE
jgi:tetratricopeptide (TPR) repeat protein